METYFNTNELFNFMTFFFIQMLISAGCRAEQTDGTVFRNNANNINIHDQVAAVADSAESG